MGAASQIVMLVGTLIVLLGVAISLIGRFRSRGDRPADHRSYFVGVALILVGVGAIWLSDLVGDERSAEKAHEARESSTPEDRP